MMMANICSRGLLSHKTNNCWQTIYPFCRALLSTERDEVVFKEDGSKGVIMLNRPAQLNALNLSMARKIYLQLRRWNTERKMKLVIIKGLGEKAFCAGGDIKAVAQAGKSSALGINFCREEYRLINEIASMRIPYVALIDGIFMGDGVGLSIHGHYRVTTERATFAMPETAIGHFPDVGASYFLPRLPGKLGLFLGLTGNRLRGRDLLEAKIATHFVCSERLYEVENDLLRMESPDLERIDALLTRYQEQCRVDLERDLSYLKQCAERINSLFNAESVEQIFENLQKDESEWAKQQLTLLGRMSPTSLKITFRALKEGQKLTLTECLKMEHRMKCQILADHDFFEGTKARLLDKTKNPRWDPRTVQEVTGDRVESYFSPPGPPGYTELHL